MGFSPAARERLIAQLIEHGFVERGSGASQFATPDLATTEKGHIAAHAVREGIEDVNVQLANKLTPDELSTFVAGLMALIEIKEESEDHDRAS
jgi:DNA-binding MarR family transcriptional regulator